MYIYKLVLEKWFKDTTRELIVNIALASTEYEPSRNVPCDLWLVQLQPVLARLKRGEENEMENWQPTGEQDSKAQHSTPQYKHNRLLINYLFWPNYLLLLQNSKQHRTELNWTEQSRVHVN